MTKILLIKVNFPVFITSSSISGPLTLRWPTMPCCHTDSMHLASSQDLLLTVNRPSPGCLLNPRLHSRPPHFFPDTAIMSFLAMHTNNMGRDCASSSWNRLWGQWFLIVTWCFRGFLHKKKILFLATLAVWCGQFTTFSQTKISWQLLDGFPHNFI